MTIHQDGILRLWTTDDGRCILASQPELLPKTQSKRKLKSLQSGGALSGVVLVTSSDCKEIYFINAYKMSVVKKLAFDVKPSGDILSASIQDRYLILKDSTKLHLWKRDVEHPPAHLVEGVHRSTTSSSMASASASYTPQQSLLLDITNADDSQIT